MYEYTTTAAVLGIHYYAGTYSRNQNQIWFIHIGGYVVLEFVVGSDLYSYHISPPRNSSRVVAMNSGVVLRAHEKRRDHDGQKVNFNRLKWLHILHLLDAANCRPRCIPAGFVFCA